MEGRAAAAALLFAALAGAILAATVPAETRSLPSTIAPEFLPVVGPLPPEGPEGDDPTDAQAEPNPAAENGAEPGASWQPAHTESYALPVDGEPAMGLLAVPSADPTTLVVLAHPWGGSASDYAEDLQQLAERGVLAVAMDFRGAEDDFKVRAGVEDTVAATLDLAARFPTVDRTLLYGHSMGGEVALLAVAAAPPGTFDYVFVGAGVTDLEALWHSFLAARPAIERETGGTPAEVPDEYRRRSPVDRIGDLADRGVARYFVVHGAGDAPVPADHAERLYEALSTAGLPVSYYVVTTDEDSAWCVPVAQVCPDPVLASHSAGRWDLMLPFVENRIDRLRDPAEAAVRGTYDGDAGTYEPSDVG